MSDLVFLPEGWEDYLYWQKQDKKTLRRVNQLLQGISRNPFEGLGKPELLRGNLSSWWSRLVDDVNRLIYRVQDNGDIEIAQCRGHYSDK